MPQVVGNLVMLGDQAHQAFGLMNVQIIGDKVPRVTPGSGGDGWVYGSSPLLYVSVPSTASRLCPARRRNWRSTSWCHAGYIRTRVLACRFAKAGWDVCAPALGCRSFRPADSTAHQLLPRLALARTMVRSAIFTSASASGSALSQ